MNARRPCPRCGNTKTPNNAIMCNNCGKPHRPATPYMSVNEIIKGTPRAKWSWCTTVTLEV